MCSLIRPSAAFVSWRICRACCAAMTAWNSNVPVCMVGLSATKKLNFPSSISSINRITKEAFLDSLDIVDTHKVAPFLRHILMALASSGLPSSVFVPDSCSWNSPIISQSPLCKARSINSFCASMPNPWIPCLFVDTLV